MKEIAAWPVIGHQRILALLELLLNQSKLLNHAFLFYGPRHLGKNLVLEEFLKRLLVLETKTLVWSQPDVHCLQRLPEKTEIGIEQVRNWQKELSLKPFNAPYKIGVIQEAENLNQESGNALLKILEEPSGSTLIFLLAHDWAKVLPTIASRLQTIAFQPVATKIIIDGLLSRGASTAQAQSLGVACCWRPGLAVNWLNQPELYAEDQKKIAFYQRVINSPVTERSALSLSIKEVEASQLNIELSYLERVLMTLIAEGLVSRQRLVKIVEHWRLAKQFVKQNVSPQFILEYLIMSL